MAGDHSCARAVVAIPLHNMAALIVQDRLLRIKLATPMFASVGSFLVTIVFFLKKNLYYVFLILMIKKIMKKKNTNTLKKSMST